MTPSMPKSPHSPQSWEELRLERLRQLRELKRQQREAKTAAVVNAEAEEYGQLVTEGDFGSGRSYERFDADGRLISSLVFEAPDGGRVVYQIVGVSCRDLV